MNFGQIKNIHFIGIGGIGMSGIAEILTNYDLQISGCDLKSSPTTQRLGRSGIPVAIGHDPAHVAQADLVVISSAVKKETPEVVRARDEHVPVIRRAEMLGELTRLKNCVAIAGTHGKTTTSAMIGMVLAEAGLDPTLIVGGVLRNLDTNAKLGRGEYLVVEADEYDRTFLNLYPSLAVITNIEADHLDCYRDLDDIRSTFAEFARRVPFYGVVAGCVDDPNVASLLDDLPKRSIRYGLSDHAELKASSLQFGELSTEFDVEDRGASLGRITLHVPGLHNVSNALAAIGIARELGIEFETIAAGLGRFTGVERRFQVLGKHRGAVVVDDYAHHPTEIRATLDASRKSYPARRIIALFQPHLYSRTRDFHAEFADALGGADLALVAPLYPSREEPIEGVSSLIIVEAAAERGLTNVSSIDGTLEEITAHVGSMLGAGDFLVTMGAGDVDKVAAMLVARTEGSE